MLLFYSFFFFCFGGLLLLSRQLACPSFNHYYTGAGASQPSRLPSIELMRIHRPWASTCTPTPPSDTATPAPLLLAWPSVCPESAASSVLNVVSVHDTEYGSDEPCRFLRMWNGLPPANPSRRRCRFDEFASLCDPLFRILSRRSVTLGRQAHINPMFISRNLDRLTGQL